MESLDLYDRQKGLDLKVPNSICVIGLGGIGSWIALFSAMVGVKKIVLIDNDTIEIHNLNRMPFRLSDVGKHKVLAISELIYERRNDIEVIPIAKRIQQLNEYERKFLEDAEYIIDCRDNTQPLPNFIHGKRIVALRYDGFKITIHFNPNYEKIWSRNVGYTVIPSFVAPPVIISAIALTKICTEFPSDEKIVTVDIRNLVKI